ncbi:MAG: nucleotide exchange factor GrpE [Bacteroidales bacterium]|nr:nucleotide exchange factor GrpE [Bacteroidales bacterium]
MLNNMNNMPQEEKNDFEDVHFEDDNSTEKDNTIHVKEKKKAKKEAILEEELLACKQNVEEANDKYLRLFSDFDNFRKRKLTEIIEIRKTAAEDLILSLLTIVDDFERAIDHLPTSERDAFQEGIILIYNKLLGSLKQQGLEEIQAKDQPFDTDFHEAITNIPVEDENMKGKVFDVTQKGYTLNGKVIRFSKVVVGS